MDVCDLSKIVAEESYMCASTEFMKSLMELMGLKEGNII